MWGQAPPAVRRAKLGFLSCPLRFQIFKQRDAIQSFRTTAMSHTAPSSLWMFGFFVALFIGIIVWSILYAKKRAQELAAAAQQIGFTFMGDTWHGPVLNPQFKTCLLQRTRGRFNNVMVGMSGNLQTVVFDYRYQAGKSSITQTMVCFSHNVQLPPFTLHPEGIFDRLSDAIVHNDIDFDSHPTFSRRYALKSPDEANTRRLFTPAVLSYMEQVFPEMKWNIEASAINLFVYRAGRTVSPADLPTFLQQASSVATALFNSDGLKNSVA
jgi:hypothetical protein